MYTTYYLKFHTVEKFVKTVFTILQQEIQKRCINFHRSLHISKYSTSILLFKGCANAYVASYSNIFTRRFVSQIVVRTFLKYLLSYTVCCMKRRTNVFVFMLGDISEQLSNLNLKEK